MKQHHPIVFALLLALSTAAPAADDVPSRVSIPKLLDPATRTETVRQFLQGSTREGLRELLAEKDLATFAERAGTIAVQPFPLHGAPAGYIVLRGIDLVGAHLLPKGDDPFAMGRLFVGRPRVLLPIPGKYGCVIRADGTSDAKENENSLFVGRRRLLADFDADGHCDVADVSTTDISVPDGRGAGKYSADTLRISQLSDPARVALEVEWNIRRPGGEPAEWWGWWFEDEDGDGVFDLKLGPSRDGIPMPRVTFHWDAKQAKWIGSGLAPEVPCRISESGRSAWAQAINDGKLTVPSAPPDAGESIMRSPSERLKADDYSHPWKPHSLAGRSHGEIFDAMTKRRTTFDFVREKEQRERKLPELWRTNPRDIARAMLRAHRDAGSRDAAWIAFATGDGQMAPEEGTVTIDDGPSGCFAPGGAFITQLHCRRDGSYLATFSTLTDWASVPLTWRRPEFDFRRIELSQAEARQLLQLVWWLNRARLWRLTDEQAGLHGFSTSDGSATVRIESDGHHMEQEATRFDRYPSWSLLGGISGSADDRTAFVNLAVWLFGEWVPEVIGERWRAEATPGFGRRHLASAALLARLHERAERGLEEFLAGHASDESATVVLEAVGANGWNDLRPLIQKISAALPPLKVREARLAAIEREIAGWVREHGEEKAGSRGHYERTESAKAAAALKNPKTADLPIPEFPGLLPPALPSPDDGTRWPVFSEQERQQFAPLDALYEEQSKLGSEQTHQERALTRLREAVSEASHRLELRDDPAGLEKWARENRWLGGFPLERLASLAPARAAAVLRERLPKAESRDADLIREALATLAPGVPVPDEWPEAALAGQRPPREGEIAQLSAHSPSDGRLNYDACVKWALTLVPPDEPHRYPWPALDEKLLAVIKDKTSAPESLEALARRAPPDAWETLASSNATVALALLIARQPEHREKFRGLLNAELTNGQRDFEHAVFAAWLADVREVAPALERLATSSETDAEGSSNPARQHLPRWVLTFWREPDATARAKALLAFALNDMFDPQRMPEAWKRMEAQFTESWRTLDGRQRADVRAFLDWCSGDGQRRILEITPGGKAASMLGRLRGLLAG